MNLLSADELPMSVMMSNNNIPVEFLELKIVSRECVETMFSLFMGGFTTSLMKQHNHFFIYLIPIVEMNGV